MDVRKLFKRRSRGRMSSAPDVANASNDPLTNAYQSPSPAHDLSPLNHSRPVSNWSRDVRSLLLGASQDSAPANAHGSRPGSTRHAEESPSQAVPSDIKSSAPPLPQAHRSEDSVRTSLTQSGRSSRSLRRGPQGPQTHAHQAQVSSPRPTPAVADLEMKRATGIPPVPPIPTTSLAGPSSAPRASQPAQDPSDEGLQDSPSGVQTTLPTRTLQDRKSIADEVRSESSDTAARRAKRKGKFSSASYYTRQKSPPPSFGQRPAESTEYASAGSQPASTSSRQTDRRVSGSAAPNEPLMTRTGQIPPQSESSHNRNRSLRANGVDGVDAVVRDLTADSRMERKSLQEERARQRRSIPSQGSNIVTGASEAPSLEGIVDLSNTTQTTVHTTQAPAVYHDTLHSDIHHIRHEKAQRDIHTHEVQHRVLPVKEVQILPTKHYAHHGPNGELIEVEESDVVTLSGHGKEWRVDPDTGKVHKVTPTGPKPMNFRNLGDKDRSHKEYINAQGVPTEETTFIHAPTVATGDEPQTLNASRDVHMEKSSARHQQKPSQRMYEQRGEDAVTAYRTRHPSANDPPVKASGSVPIREPTRVEQEREAEAVIAARRAALR